MHVPRPVSTPTPAQDTFQLFDELKARAEKISYQKLLVNNGNHTGTLVWHLGQVSEVLHLGNGNVLPYQIQANVKKVNDNWENPLFLYYSGPRLEENDIIEFVGFVGGLVTYEIDFGRRTLVPSIRDVLSRMASKDTIELPDVRSNLPEPDPAELLALHALYEATSGPKWQGYGNWVSEKSVWKWGGVTLNGEGHVVKIDLSAGSIRGHIPQKSAISPSSHI